MICAVKDKISIKWQKLLRMIPGYDPIATAQDCHFDEQTAQDAIDFIETHLTHVEGALFGKPFLLEDWQKSIVGNIFGWKRPDGTRRYREVLEYVGRKNGKTPLAACIENYIFFCDNEHGQENCCLAGDAEQAGMIFKHVMGQIKHNKELQDRCKLYEGYKAVTMESDGSHFKVLTSEAKTKHGGNPHFVIVDELHIQPNRDLVDVLQTAMISANRKQPLLMYLTTADYSRESICNEIYEYACKVRNGIITDVSFLPVIYEAKDTDDWTDPKTWLKANPNLDVSVSMDSLKRSCQKAQEIAAYENTFKRLHLNLRTQQEVRWFRIEDWDACTGNVNATELEGHECYGGLDLSSTTDLTSFELFFPEGNKILSFYWIPDNNAHRREKKDRVPYLTWARQGHIKMTLGNVIDYDIVRNDIVKLGEKYNIKEIAIDRWAATQITTQLEGDGFKMIPFGQGFASMTAPSKALETLIVSHELQHGNHPVLRWNADNVMAELDAAGNVKPSKKKSTERIDGIVALIMAIGRAIIKPATSVYEDRGLLKL